MRAEIKILSVFGVEGGEKMGKKLVMVIGILVAIGAVIVLLGSGETKPEKAPEKEKVKEVPPLVKEYQECPLPLRKYAKAFTELGYKRWQKKDLEDALNCFGTAAKIYGDIINVQNRRPSFDKKLRSYQEFVRILTESRLAVLLAKIRLLLLLDKRKDALRELLNIVRICGKSSRFPQNEIARKLLQKEFYITGEDLKDLGIELLR